MKIRSFTAVVGLGAVLLVTAGSAAQASPSGHPIDGTCYENGAWFKSSNVRTMGGTYVKASFASTPTHGVVFQIVNYNTGVILGNAIYAPPTGTQTLYSKGRVGTKFVNMYRLQSSGHQDQYSFTGGETY